MESIHKYPRTQHIEGSRLQPGDTDLSAMPLDALRSARLVIEEKLDGANAALSFTEKGVLRLQSRGHYLVGGTREKHFALLKTWASVHQRVLFERIQDRYVVYGEWLYAKHTIFYDALPHYFMEFDVLDVARGVFLSTPARRALLGGLPLASVPVIATGTFTRSAELEALVAPSLYKTKAWRATLRAHAEAEGVDADRVGRETDPSDLSEGLYIKHEDDDAVLGRYKWVRSTFLTSVIDSGSHWLDRPIIPNRLAEGVDVFAS